MTLELLAPAGDREALQAALEAGANAVYFGLKSLNARRRAKNFLPDEFREAVAAAHGCGVRAYLTLNTDLAEREIGQAARILEFARQAGIDAVLVRDPALLALRSEYPEIEFHFSTQSCTANSADVRGAKALGANRVVLAREMSLTEIAAASAVPAVATEVFVQGALCFSVSGRCLLSSWVGGRSGNRGACTSPCRVPWSVDDTAVGAPFSMHDLSALDRIDALKRSGVAGLKIEGRLKKAEWVKQAVGLYRRILDGENVETLLREAQELGNYAGRAATSDYFDGKRDQLTGLSAGRISSHGGALREKKESAEEETACDEGIAEVAKDEDLVSQEAFTGSDDFDPFDQEFPTYDFSMTLGPKGILCRCLCGSRAEEWTIPKTVVKREAKAVSIGAFFERLTNGVLDGYQLGERTSNDPEYLLVPRAINALIERIAGVIRRGQKPPEEFVRLELPPRVRELTEPGEANAANRLSLGSPPNRARIEAKHVAGFVKRAQPSALIVEGIRSGQLSGLLEQSSDVQLIVALPSIFFEEEVTEVRRLVELCVESRLPVEINNWGGWMLAKEAGALMEAGPGMGVLNSLAARKLREWGMKSATVSVEADRRQMEAFCRNAAVPCSIVVFGRPALLTTRVRMPDALLGVELRDRRDTRLIGRRERGLTIFRPTAPFDLRDVKNEKIKAKYLVVDLVGSDDPLADWLYPPVEDDRPFRFNYDRTLA